MRYETKNVLFKGQPLVAVLDHTPGFIPLLYPHEVPLLEKADGDINNPRIVGFGLLQTGEAGPGYTPGVWSFNRKVGELSDVVDAVVEEAA
jgi:hypothetical protein